MAVEYFCIVSASKLQILSDTGTSYKLKAFCPGSLRFLLCLFGDEPLLKVDEDRVLMAGNHNVYVVRIDDAQPYRGHADLWLPKKHVI